MRSLSFIKTWSSLLANKNLRGCLVLLCFALAVVSPPLKAERQFELALITQRDAGDAFWQPVEDFMRVVCDSLGMRLSVYHAKHDAQMVLTLLDRAHAEGADLLIFPNYKKTAARVIERANSLGMKTLLINADLSSEDKAKVGAPREKYENWIASLMPDDMQAGSMLSRYLIEQAKFKGMHASDGRIQMIGIAGSVTETASILRIEGLRADVAKTEGVVLNQVVYAHWKPELAAAKAAHLLNRYPETRVFWVASDLMADAVSEKLKAQGLLSGKDFLIGGIDWAAEGLQGLSDGNLHYSIGGHYLDGGWAAIMAYDYLKGSDFAQVEGLNLVTKMHVLEYTDLPEFVSDGKLSKKMQEYDYRLLTRTHNSEQFQYKFSASMFY